MKNALYTCLSFLLIGCAAEEELTQTPSNGDHLNPNLTYGSVTDCSGNTYATIEIGGQEWMAENLRTTCYANGDPIINVTDNNSWLNLQTGGWCHYENDPQMDVPFGKLYNWKVVEDSRNVCPIGWHVPNHTEWGEYLINYLDPIANGGYTTANSAGGKMKSSGTIYWENPNTGATNESGFSGLPGGYRSSDGPFYGLNERGYWWCVGQYLQMTGWGHILWADNPAADGGVFTKERGLSIRCIKD